MKKVSKVASSENKLKVSLLQAEKRLVDLELSVTELKEKLKDVDFEGIKSLQEKVDELENLIMVENAGIIELKKMLESGTVAPEIEKRITGLEEKVTIPGKVPSTAIQKQIQTIANELNKLRDETNKEIVKIKEKPSIDVQFLSSKIDSLKSTVDKILNKRVETELKIQTLEKLLTEIRTKEELPGDLFEDIKNIRKEWLVVSGRVDSIEKVVKEIFETIPRLESSLSKFETFEKASLISKELSNKLEQFKFIESETNRLSSKIEMIYNNIDKRLDKVREIEKRLPMLSDTVSNLEKEIDKNKIDILDRIKRDDAEERFEDIKKSLPLLISSQMKQIKSKNVEFEKREEEIKREIDELRNSMNQKMNEIKKKTNVEEIRKELDIFKEFMEKRINTRFVNLINEVNEKVSEIQIPPILDTQMSEMVNKLVFLETRLAAIERMIRETSKIQPIIIE